MRLSLPVCFLSFLGLVNQGLADGTCNTEGCQRAARTLHSSIDFTTDPCENFYQFACGKWMDNNPVPKEATSATQLGKLNDEILDSLKDAMEAPTTKKDPKSFGKTRRLYKSCMNTDYLQKHGIKELRAVAKETFGGWPMIHQPVSSKFRKLTDVMLALDRLSIHPIFAVTLISAAEDKKITLLIGKGDLGMHPAYYGMEFSRRGAYEIFIRDVATMLGGPKMNIPKDAYQIMKFETSLANILQKEKTDIMDLKSTYRRITVGQLYKTVDKSFDWVSYLNKVFEEVDVKIEESTEVVLFNEDYVRSAVKMFQMMDERLVRNYLLWVGIRKLLPYAGTEAEKHLTMLKKRTQKTIYVAPPRSRKCTKDARSRFSSVLSRFFVNRSYDKGTNIVVEEMFRTSEEAVRELLNKTTWLDDDTRSVLLNKNEGIAWYIGYRTYIMNDKVLDNIYDWAEVKHKSYLINTIRLKEASRKDFLGYLKRYSGRNQNPASTRGGKRKQTGPGPFDWIGIVDHLELPGDSSEDGNTIEYMSSTDVNAWYNHQSLKISITAGILQEPLFDLDFPDAMNYGTVGSIALHEIGHAYGVTGIQFDHDGYLRNFVNETTAQKFSNRVKCFIKQYDQYTYKGIQMDGYKTVNENVADYFTAILLKSAYQKYKEANNLATLTLPDVSLNEEQILFTRFAQAFCENRPNMSIKSRVLEGVHSFGKTRVNGAYRNSKDFAETSNCPVGSYMNPAKKCSFF